MGLAVLLLGGCSVLTEVPAEETGSEPEPVNRSEEPAVPGAVNREVVLDYFIGDLEDPAVLAKYSRVDLLITDPARFWGRDGVENQLDLLRAANPDIKILAYFRTKCIREEWGEADEPNAYSRDLYTASLPYWSYTTTGDTLRDWPGVILFDQANPRARQAMLAVFARYQESSTNKFDGMFWDYFNTSLWIAPTVTDMTGDPDLDGDGVAHWDDDDELAAFQEAEISWILEVRASLGDDFIQIANGWRALQDESFAALVDGMFYEIFPDVGFSGSCDYGQALDASVANNLFTASTWPRRANGGPWLILSNKNWNTRFQDQDGNFRTLDLGDVNRAIALITDCYAVHYHSSGHRIVGIPEVEPDLGRPLGQVTIDGNVYHREFENGHVEVVVNEAGAPFPVSFEIVQDDSLLQQMDLPFMYP